MPTTFPPSSQHSTESTNGYHTIGEAADILGVSVPTIRMYEREGLIIPYRKDSRHRRFSGSVIAPIRCMRQVTIGKEAGIAEIRRLLALELHSSLSSQHA
jgi:DNA-binding transcriptional MerR regulator